MSVQMVVIADGQPRDFGPVHSRVGALDESVTSFLLAHAVLKPSTNTRNIEEVVRLTLRALSDRCVWSSIVIYSRPAHRLGSVPPA